MIFRLIHAFFISNIFFQLSLIVQNLVSILLRCSLIHITIIMLVYVCLFLDLGLFMPHLCDLFFIFNVIFIVINHIKQRDQFQTSFCFLKKLYRSKSKQSAAQFRYNSIALNLAYNINKLCKTCVLQLFVSQVVMS